jgi:ribonuclease ZC3H12
MPKVHNNSKVPEALPTASSSKGVVKLKTKPYKEAPSNVLRQVVIDGSNVGMAHGGHEHFSVKGISICVKYFTKLGHKTVVMLPRHRWTRASTKEREDLDSLERSNVLFYTPARKTPKNSWFCHDDRFIVDYATKHGAIVLTKDNYRDLNDEPTFRNTIENRLLTYMWVDNTLMIPNDPMGRDGPKLEQFLRK